MNSQLKTTLGNKLLILTQIFGHLSLKHCQSTHSFYKIISYLELSGQMKPSFSLRGCQSYQSQITGSLGKWNSIHLNESKFLKAILSQDFDSGTPEKIERDPMCPSRNLECSLLVTGRSDEFYKDKCKDVRIQKYFGFSVHAELKVEAQAGRMEVLKSSYCQKKKKITLGEVLVLRTRGQIPQTFQVGQERKDLLHD